MKKTMKRLMALVLSLAMIMTCLPNFTNVVDAKVLSGAQLMVFPTIPLHVGEKFSDVKLFSIDSLRLNINADVTNIKFYEVEGDVKSPCSGDSFRGNQEYAIEFEWTPYFDDIKKDSMSSGNAILGDYFSLMNWLPNEAVNRNSRSYHRDYAEGPIYEWHEKTSGSKTKVVTLKIDERDLEEMIEFNYYLLNTTSGKFEKVRTNDAFKIEVEFANIRVALANEDVLETADERLLPITVVTYERGTQTEATPETVFSANYSFAITFEYDYEANHGDDPYSNSRLILDGHVLKDYNLCTATNYAELPDILTPKSYTNSDKINFAFLFNPYDDTHFIDSSDVTLEDVKVGDTSITIDIDGSTVLKEQDYVLLSYKGNLTKNDLFEGSTWFNKFCGSASRATVNNNQLVFSDFVQIAEYNSDYAADVYDLTSSVSDFSYEGNYTYVLMPDYGTTLNDRMWGYNNIILLNEEVDGPVNEVLEINDAKLGTKIMDWFKGVNQFETRNNKSFSYNVVCLDEYNDLSKDALFDKDVQLNVAMFISQPNKPSSIAIKRGTNSDFKNVQLDYNPDLRLYLAGIEDADVSEYARNGVFMNYNATVRKKIIKHYKNYQNCYNYYYDYKSGCYYVLYKFTLDFKPIDKIDVKGYILEGYNSGDFSFPTNGTVETKKWFVDNIEQTEDFDFEKGKEYKLSLKLTDVNVEPKDGIRIGNTLITDKSVDEASLALATSSSYFYDEDEHTLSIIYIDTVKEPINVDLKFGQGFIEEDFDFYNSSNEVNELLAKKDYENYTVSVEGVYEDEALTNDAKDVDKAVLGTTYYAKLHIQPKVDHTFNNTTLFVDGLPYDENHPNYIGEATSDGNGGFFIAAKLETKKISEFTPSLNMMNKDIKKPSDINLGTSTGEDIEDEDAFGSLFVKNATDSYYGAVALDKIEFYKDDKFVKGMNSSENFGDNKFYIKAVYDLSNIYGNGDLLSDILSGRNDSELALDVRNSFASPDSYVVMSTNNGYYGQYIRPVYTKVNKKDMTMEIGYEWKDISSAPHITGISLENKTDTEVTLKVTGTNLSKENAHVSIIKVNGGSLGSSKQLQSDPNCTVVDGNTMQFTFQLEEPMGSDECLVNIGNSIDGYQPLVYSFTFGINKQTSSGSKKYKATDSNDTAEKISGSGKKGSKRTITPEEGRKVSNVVVTDKQGNRVDVTKNADGTYSFIQPASDVNIEVSYKNREITLNIGSTEASVDGERETLDVTPVIRNDRTMLPIRFVAENLGAKVEWSEKNPNYVLITKGDIKIEITLGSDKMLVNGKEVKLDSVAFAENDRTYLPVRAVSENLNAIVEWNEARPMEVKIYER